MSATIQQTHIISKFESKFLLKKSIKGGLDLKNTRMEASMHRKRSLGGVRIRSKAVRSRSTMGLIKKKQGSEEPECSSYPAAQSNQQIQPEFKRSTSGLVQAQKKPENGSVQRIGKSNIKIRKMTRPLLRSEILRCFSSTQSNVQRSSDSGVTSNASPLKHRVRRGWGHSNTLNLKQNWANNLSESRGKKDSYVGSRSWIKPSIANKNQVEGVEPIKKMAEDIMDLVEQLEAKADQLMGNSTHNDDNEAIAGQRGVLINHPKNANQNPLGQPVSANQGFCPKKSRSRGASFRVKNLEMESSTFYSPKFSKKVSPKVQSLGFSLSKKNSGSQFNLNSRKVKGYKKSRFVTLCGPFVTKEIRRKKDSHRKVHSDEGEDLKTDSDSAEKDQNKTTGFNNDIERFIRITSASRRIRIRIKNGKHSKKQTKVKENKNASQKSLRKENRKNKLNRCPVFMEENYCLLAKRSKYRSVIDKKTKKDSLDIASDIEFRLASESESDPEFDSEEEESELNILMDESKMIRDCTRTKEIM